MSRGRKKRTLRDLNIEGPTNEELERMFLGLKGSTDRNIVILTSSSVEWYLGQLIIEKLPNATAKSSGKLFDISGPLSTLYAKNQLGFALGLYDKKILNDLEIIRRVRNSFAHAPKPITLRTAELSEECQKLILGKDEEYTRLLDKHGVGGSVTLRRQFVMACVALNLLFLRETLRLSKNKLRRIRYRIKKSKNPLGVNPEPVARHHT